MKKDEDRWIAESPMGKVSVRFFPIKDFGVIDHDVTIENGKTFHNPLRVLQNGNGSEVVFTLYRLPEMSDDDFTHDANMILKDLKKLKELIEKDHS